MIYLFGNSKGGVGKTTCCVNFAVWLANAGKDVLIVEADRQASIEKWAEYRAENPDLLEIGLLQKFTDLGKELKKLKSKHQHILVDVAGRNSEELRQALEVADRLIIPLQPTSQLDVDVLPELVELVDSAKERNKNLKAVVLLNQCPPNPDKNKRVCETVELIESEYGLKVLKSKLVKRFNFQDSVSEGKGVAEASACKARTELHSLSVELSAI